MAAVHQYYTVYHDEDDRSVDSWTGAVALKSIAGRCLCGWRGRRRPDTAESGVQAFTEWWTDHYTPLVRPDPRQVLILGGDGERRRHFLGGQAVVSGTTLELLLSGDRWVPVRYEWSSRADAAPRFYVELGGPWETVEEHGPETYVLVPLDRAVFRWPEADGCPYRSA
jgi:hypothetical protein